MAVCSEIHTKHINKFCRRKFGVFMC